MDSLSLNFAQEQALRAVDSCTDLEELKVLTRSLVKGTFESRAFINLLMTQNLGAPARTTLST